jgi:nicotinamide-nucleotide amidase
MRSTTLNSPSDSEMCVSAEAVAGRLLESGLMIAVAESCTGGWVAKVCTDLAGSSQWFERGFVTYTNQAKREMLGVTEGTLAVHGAVSEATVAEMATGALHNSRANIALAISGIAGPGGATDGKPVGTVCFGFARQGGETWTERCHFEGDREAVRRQSVLYGLQGILRRLNG